MGFPSEVYFLILFPEGACCFVGSLVVSSLTFFTVSSLFLRNLSKKPIIWIRIPWLAEEADGWAKKNFAKDLENPDLPSIYVDEVAVTAFKHLKFAFSESHPRTPAEYRAALCQTLQILIENGIRFEPQAMQSALVQKCGWGPVSAKQIAELSDIFLSSQSPAGYDGHGPWEPDIIKLWKIEAQKKDTKWYTGAPVLKLLVGMRLLTLFIFKAYFGKVFPGGPPALQTIPAD